MRIIRTSVVEFSFQPPFQAEQRGAGTEPAEEGGAFPSCYRIDPFASLFPSAAVRTRGSSRRSILDESTAGSRLIGSLLDNNARRVNGDGRGGEGGHALREADESRANLDVTSNGIGGTDEREWMPNPK